MTQTQTETEATTTASKQTCDRCHGVIHATRRVSLTVALANHEPACPGAPKPRKS